MPTKRVTWVPLLARELRALRACSEAVRLFARTFPHGATPDDVGAALAAGLPVEWLLNELLPAPALAEYKLVQSPAWAEYQRVRATALADALASVWPVWEAAHDAH